MALIFSQALDAAPTPQGQAGDVPDDEEIVVAAQADPRAFATLYERYLNPIYRYCYNRLGSREAAEDAAGEVFLKALANLPAYRRGTFAAWLYAIARNVVTDTFRRVRPAQGLEEADGADSGPAAESLSLAGDETAALRAALARLPEEQRAVIELPAAGWSDAQIGEMVKKTPAAVRMLRYRAMQRLRKLLFADERLED